ncbi:MAG: hypothetical protein AAB444_00635 [Patescibacteria group bacterium]
MEIVTSSLVIHYALGGFPFECSVVNPQAAGPLFALIKWLPLTFLGDESAKHKVTPPGYIVVDQSNPQQQSICFTIPPDIVGVRLEQPPDGCTVAFTQLEAQGVIRRRFTHTNGVQCVLETDSGGHRILEKSLPAGLDEISCDGSMTIHVTCSATTKGGKVTIAIKIERCETPADDNQTRPVSQVFATPQEASSTPPAHTAMGQPQEITVSTDPSGLELETPPSIRTTTPGRPSGPNHPIHG